MHIKNTSFTVYIKGKYIPNKHHTTIRSHCGAKDAREFLMNKFNWPALTCYKIEYEIQGKFILTQSYSKQKTIKNVILYWLASGKKNYGQYFMCPHYQSLDNPSMTHDHFPQCILSIVRK